MSVNKNVNGTLVAIANDCDDSKSIASHVTITSETGATVDIRKGNVTISPTETSTGIYECDLKTSDPQDVFGTWTIHSVLDEEDVTATLVVDTIKKYEITVLHFHADIIVTFPEGATCSCGKSGETPVYADQTPYTFNVGSAGDYIVTVSAYSQTYTDTVTITTSEQEETVILPVGSTVTPTDDVQTLLACAMIGDSEITTLAGLLADSTTLSAVIASNNAIDYLVRSIEFAKREALVPTMTSDTAPKGKAFCTVVRSGYQPYKAFDGNNTSVAVSSTSAQESGLYIGYEFTEPIKARYCIFICSNAEVATLKCEASDDNVTWETVSANITTVQDTSVSLQLTPTKAYKYYRLYQISVNPANTFNFKTIQFYNVDEGFTDNANAMSYIGLSNYASNTLLEDSTWRSAICNSTYFEYVLNKKNPNMTSNTTPSGVASSNDSYSSELSLGPAYKAFDGNTGSRWGSRTNVESAGYYVQYKFPQNYDFYMVVLNRVISGAACTFVVEGYINGAWVELFRHATSYTGKVIFSKKNTDRFRTRGISGNRYIGLYEMTMYGREDV